MSTSSVQVVGRPLDGADIIRQLDIEIKDRYGNLRAFTTELGRDYHTYRNYIVGKRQMGTDLLMESLAVLGVDPGTFFTLARQRVEAEESQPQ